MNASPNPPRCKTRRRLNALSVAKMFIEMQRYPVTMHELVGHTGLAIMTVRSYVLTLHKLGGCYIAHWEQDRRGEHRTPAFTIGDKRDAKKPVTSAAERSRRYRAKLAHLHMLHATAGAAA